MKIYVSLIGNLSTIYNKTKKYLSYKKEKNSDHSKWLKRIINDQIYNCIWILQSHSKCCFWRIFDTILKQILYNITSKEQDV